jgi:hypothetical protein
MDKIILFMDDCNERAAVLYQRMTERARDRTFWTSTVEEALGVLIDYRDRLEVVYLEHDLNSDHFVHSGREDCGMEVVRWLEKQDSTKYSHCHFVIHTWNAKAGIKMTERLKAAGYRAHHQPFGL